MSRLTVLLACLILSFLSSCGNSGTLNVTQSPPNITVQTGGSADMRCCWGGHLSLQQVRVKWKRKNASDAIIDSMVKKNSETQKHEKNKYNLSASGNCSILTITTVSANDTGVYICVISIEIPQLLQGDGSGTQLTVQEPNDTNGVSAYKPPSAAVMASLISATAVMVVLCLTAFLCYWRKKKLMPYPGQTSGRVGMVIYEAPHGEGEEVEEGEVSEAGDHSTSSSRGSTQWSAVPVYESVDYFDVQNSGDG
ncbi:hypothetical protein MATL_G00196460 [Megalops atlanticus]|uniref:Ig-like domain-containing protein n=1 Tax=Megalops atlanticus TaxID=7932 RepID=A0A9D3SYP8_MEGAT|nr:hypothetical protein MATL_G00196460 [Megalops atlanticus]